MKNVTGLPGQTAFDIVLENYGSLETGLRWLLEDNAINNQFAVVPETVNGQVLKIREDFVNKSVIDYYTKPVVTY